VAHPTHPRGIKPVKDGTPAERSAYWRIVDRDAATAFATLRESGTSCIRFGSMASDVMRAVDDLCRSNGVDTKIAKRADIGLDYYRADTWAEVAGESRHGLWGIVQSLRERVAA
jgi:hypothetical protein